MSKIYFSSLISAQFLCLLLILKNAQASSFRPRKLIEKSFHIKESIISLHDPETCELPPALIEEIQAYQEIANQIIFEATEGEFKGRTYRELGKFVDKHGSRLSGSQSLEDAIDYMIEKMRNELDTAYPEEAIVPHWVRGKEEAHMLSPREKKLAILGLGRSVGTTTDGIEADVIVVRSFEELEARKAEVPGKIVVYNQDYVDYGSSVQYRSRGATEASKRGAVAALIRSIAPFSLDTPHTGGQSYDEGDVHIPSACITIEDAELMNRIQDEGETIRIHLTMLDFNLPLTTSRNAIGELTGSNPAYRDRKVIVSGHIDSWDVGQGAMDDGGGCFISTEALNLIKHLGLQPKRSMQAILWTAEEMGLYGGEDYARHHINEMDKITAAFESDSGTFKPLGLDFAGSEEAGCIIYEILKLTEGSLNTTMYAMHESVSTDITHLTDHGVPGISLMNADDEYFFYHHTEADTMTMMDSEELDQGMALWALVSYVIADLNDDLPRKVTKIM